LKPPSKKLNDSEVDKSSYNWGKSNLGKQWFLQVVDSMNMGEFP
jgi:hypothetical protein